MGKAPDLCIKSEVWCRQHNWERRQVIYHRFKQKGRRYAKGKVGRNLPRKTRKTCLFPYWEFDIKNCWPAILLEWARRQNLHTPRLRCFCEDEMWRRHLLAAGYRWTPVKKAVNAWIFGSGTQRREAQGLKEEIRMITDSLYNSFPPEGNQGAPP